MRTVLAVVLLPLLLAGLLLSGTAVMLLGIWSMAAFSAQKRREVAIAGALRTLMSEANATEVK